MFKSLTFNIWIRYFLIKMWIKGDLTYNFKTKKIGLGRNLSEKEGRAL